MLLVTVAIKTPLKRASFPAVPGFTPEISTEPALPGTMDRVIYSGRVLLIDSNNKILDVFNLDDTQ